MLTQAYKLGAESVSALLTKLPISVEPRAKMKMMSRQPLRVNSLAVVPTDCRSARSRSATSTEVGFSKRMGLAVARVARKAVIKTFILNRGG